MIDTDFELPPDARLRRELRFLVEEFNGDYAAALDAGDVTRWTTFFTDDALYRVIARDNVESNLPLCLVLCEGMGMIKDRAFAIMHTEMFAPRYVQHQVSMTRVTGVDGDMIRAAANYVVYETLIDEPTRVLQVGRYEDEFLMMSTGRLLLKKRTCIFDTVVVPNCLVYPI